MPDSSPTKLRSSSTSANLSSKRRNVCVKRINHAKNLEKHLRNCDKAPTHPAKRQLLQTTLDGPTSSKNGPSTPKKLMTEEVQVGGAPTKHTEHWKATEIVESSLKYTALTFRKTLDINDKRDVLQRYPATKDVIHSMRRAIEGETRTNAEAVK